MALSGDLEVTTNKKTKQKNTKLQNRKFKFYLLLLFVLAMEVPTA